MDIIGWFGAILLAFCAIPQAIQSWHDKHSNGLNWIFIASWFIGEICTLIYVLPKADFPLIFNYAMNIILLGVIIYYKIWPSK